MTSWPQPNQVAARDVIVTGASSAPFSGSGFGDALANEDFDVDPSNPTFNGQPQYINTSGNRWICWDTIDPNWNLNDAVNNGNNLLYWRETSIAGAWEVGTGVEPAGVVAAN